MKSGDSVRSVVTRFVSRDKNNAYDAVNLCLKMPIVHTRRCPPSVAWPRGGHAPLNPVRPVHEIRVNSMRNVCTPPHPCPKQTWHDDGSATLMSPIYGNNSLFTTFDNNRLSIILLIILYFILLFTLTYNILLRTCFRQVGRK